MDQQPFSWKQIIGFVKIEILSAIFGETPTQLYSQGWADKFGFRSHVMPQAEYKVVFQALKKPYNDEHVPYEFDEGFQCCETIVNNTCRPAFAKGVTIAALDDDKFGSTSRDAAEAGLALRHIKKNLYVSNYCTMCVLTQDLLFVCIAAYFLFVLQTPSVARLRQNDTPTIEGKAHVMQVLKALSLGYGSGVGLGADAQSQMKLDSLVKLNKVDLVQLCRDNNVPVSGNKKVLAARLVDANIDMATVEVQPEKSMEQGLHDTWFMKPIRQSTLTSDALRKGSANEDRILKWLPNFITRNSMTMELCAIKEYGLIAPHNDRWMATSVDGLLAIHEATQQGDDMVENNWLAIAKLKTRTTIQSRHVLKTIADSLGERKLATMNLRLDDEESLQKYRKLVPNKDYRQQVLHHCVVAGVTRGLYVEATMTSIQYAVLVHFHEDVIDAYKTTMEDVMFPKLKVFHETGVDDSLDSIKEEFEKVKDGPGHAVDQHTYLLTFAIYRAWENLVLQGTPVPATRRLLTAVQNYWNRLKGGVDVFSRLLKNGGPSHEGLNLYATVNIRCLFILLGQQHLLRRGFDSVAQQH